MYIPSVSCLPHFSQSHEDEVIKYVLETLGIHIGWFVEFGAGDSRILSNTARLADVGWNGVYIEADADLYQKLLQHIKTGIYPLHATVTAENINELLTRTPLPQEFDLLSIDIDGNDYWVWKAITYRPKVVCIEYNSNFGPTESRVIEYDPAFIYQSDNYYGASALALVRLGERLGYTLINHTAPLNLFFVRNDLVEHFEILDVKNLVRCPVHIGSPRTMIETPPC